MTASPGREVITEVPFERQAACTELVIAVPGFVFSLVLDEIERMLIPSKAKA